MGTIREEGRSNMPDPTEIPAGMMRVWDAQQKKIIFVADPAAEPDRITFTMRVHDAAEKQKAENSTCWAVIQIDRADVGKLSAADFVAKYVAPHLTQLKLLQLQ